MKKVLCVYVIPAKKAAEVQVENCLGCGEKWMHAVCDDNCLKCSNRCCEYRKNIVDSLIAIGRKYKEDQAAVNQFVSDLYKKLSPQIDAIMLSDELSRIRNQRYLDRLAYGEAACSRVSYDIDFDSYDDSQLFFEKQHGIR